MRANDTDLTVDCLKEHVSYDPKTGLFTWLVTKKGGGASAGTPASAKTATGYATITINRHRYRAHRLAWLYMTGRWPALFVDHINGVRDDNRFENLREATSAENLQNMKYARSHSRHGFLGVSYHKANAKWCANIAEGGKRYYLGSFATAAEAKAAYLGAKKVLHPFNTINDSPES